MCVWFLGLVLDSGKWFWILGCVLGRDPFNQNSDRSDREKWSTSKGGPVFSNFFWLDRTDPLSFGPKFPEILVEWIAPLDSGKCFVPNEPPYTTFVITWHKYLGSSTADHINLWFGIKWAPGRNERGEVSGTKKPVVPPTSFMALRDRFRSFLGLDVGIFIIYTDCAVNLLRNSVERKVYSIDKCKLIFA